MGNSEECQLNNKYKEVVEVISHTISPLRKMGERGERRCFNKYGDKEGMTPITTKSVMGSNNHQKNVSHGPLFCRFANFLLLVLVLSSFFTSSMCQGESFLFFNPLNPEIYFREILKIFLNH